MNTDHETTAPYEVDPFRGADEIITGASFGRGGASYSHRHISRGHSGHTTGIGSPATLWQTIHRALNNGAELEAGAVYVDTTRIPDEAIVRFAVRGPMRGPDVTAGHVSPTFGPETRWADDGEPFGSLADGRPVSGLDRVATDVYVTLAARAGAEVWELEEWLAAPMAWECWRCGHAHRLERPRFGPPRWLADHPSPSDGHARRDGCDQCTKETTT